MRNKPKLWQGKDEFQESLISCLLLSLTVLVANVSFADSLLLTGATVHTVAGETLSPGQVLLKDDKIAAVGTALNAAGVTTIDLKGQHLYPGLIGVNTTLGLLEISSVRATKDTTEVGQYTPDVRAWIAVNPESELIPVARANGITHAHVVPYGAVVSGQSGLIALSGWTTEEMTIKKQAALHVFWPTLQLDTRPKEELKSKWKSLEDQARDRRAKLKELDDFFAEAKAYAKGRAVAGQNSAPDTGIVPAWEAMLPFVRGELPLMVHADELRQIKTAVSWAETNGYKIILAGGRDAAQVAGLLASNKIAVAFEDIYTQPAQDTASYDVYFSTPAILHRVGVKLVICEGGRFDASSLRNLPYTAAQAVAFGLPADEALKSITLYPAQILGVAERLGSIEAGKEATLFVADGDILDIRANVKRMWIAGREVSLESRHTRLYQKYRQRPPRK